MTRPLAPLRARRVTGPLAALAPLAVAACVPAYRETLVTPETRGSVLAVDGRPITGAELYYAAAPDRRARTEVAGAYHLPETRRRDVDLVLPVSGAVMVDHALAASAPGYRPVTVPVRAPSWSAAPVDLPPIVLSTSDAFPSLGPDFAASADLAVPADCARKAWEDAAALWRVARQAAAGARSGPGDPSARRTVVASAYHHAREAWDRVQPTCDRRAPYAGWTQAGALEARLDREAEWVLQASPRPS